METKEKTEIFIPMEKYENKFEVISTLQYALWL